MVERVKKEVRPHKTVIRMLQPECAFRTETMGVHSTNIYWGPMPGNQTHFISMTNSENLSLNVSVCFIGFKRTINGVSIES